MRVRLQIDKDRSVTIERIYMIEVYQWVEIVNQTGKIVQREQFYVGKFSGISDKGRVLTPSDIDVLPALSFDDVSECVEYVLKLRHDFKDTNYSFEVVKVEV